MPGNFLSADTNFPQFSGQESTAEKIERIMSYLFMLQEQLRYTMANLGQENFNETGLGELGTVILGPFSVRVEGMEGNLSKLEETVNSITLEVSNGDDRSTIRLLANGIAIASKVVRFTGMVTFTDLSSGSTTTINGANIQTGTINAKEVVMYGEDDGEGGGFSAALGSDGKRTTYGAKVYGKGGDYYCIATNAGVCMRGPQASLYVSGGNIHASTAITEGSDRNLKNSIDYDLTKYEDFFRRLKPVFYKFNDGTSDRFHLGFIAQEVEQALHEAGLTAQDFAGLVIDTKEDPENPSHQIIEYGLRYSEFISLNTYMTQQLCEKVQTLEDRIAKLEAKINGETA